MYYLYIFIAICAVVFIYTKLFGKRTDTTEIKKTIYKYQAKQSFMTKSEDDFFYMLNNVAGDRYFIFPQAHLSAILDHKVKNGQNWNAAFRHINSKSVDYVLCDKQTLKPIYAVELDDYTHSRANRKERDIEVERIFASSDIPLVRFSNYKSLTKEDIINKFYEAKNIQ